MVEIEAIMFDEKFNQQIVFEAAIVFSLYYKGTSLEDRLAIFKEIVIDLETSKLKYDEEDLKLISLCLLPASYVSFGYTILYSRDSLTIKKKYNALFSKEKIQHLIGFEAHEDSLVVHGGDVSDRLRFNYKIYNFCKKKWHIKKTCFKLQNMKKKKSTVRIVISCRI